MSTVKAVRVSCRNNKTVYGTLRMYDKHFNVVVEVEDKRELFIRGDSIISISKVVV